MLPEQRQRIHSAIARIEKSTKGWLEMLPRNRSRSQLGYARKDLLAALAMDSPTVPSPTPVPVKPSVYSQLGAWVHNAVDFSVDSPTAVKFLAAGGRYVMVEFASESDARNRHELTDRQWAQRWRAAGVLVGGWWRIENLPAAGTPVSPVPMDLWGPNPESAAELVKLPSVMEELDSLYPRAQQGVITLAKMPGFPTGLIERYDAHVIMENFLEQSPTSDHSVTNGVAFWKNSGVPLERLHACLLFAGSVKANVAGHMAEVRATGVKGVSAFVGEATPGSSWAGMA
jgi:hypothetical protein